MRQIYLTWITLRKSLEPAVLAAAGSNHPAYNGVEMMSRMELVCAVRDMELYMKDIAIRCVWSRNGASYPFFSENI